MRTSLTFGQVKGIPLKVHLNWFLTAGLVTWSLARGYFPQEYPGWELSVYWLAGLITGLLFFGSVLFHELGHALVAQQEGVPVNSITLFVFGGIAHIANEPPTARSEFRIVIAGPFTSFVLAGFFYLIGSIPALSLEVRSAANYLSGVSILLGAFNMLPGFPLDGGRVLRSLLWSWKGDFHRATRWATHAGLAVALLFFLGGAVLMIQGNLFNGLWVALIGSYLGLMARDGYRQAELFDPAVVEPIPYSSRDRWRMDRSGKTAAGLFQRFEDANRAVGALGEAGFSSKEISVLAHAATIHPGHDKSTHRAYPGSLARQLVKVGAVAIPGIGPIVGAGVLAAQLGAATGATLSGVIGALAGLGIPDEQAREYAEGVKRGGVLVTVLTGEGQVELAYTVIQQAGGRQPGAGEGIPVPGPGVLPVNPVFRDVPLKNE